MQLVRAKQTGREGHAPNLTLAQRSSPPRHRSDRLRDRWHRMHGPAVATERQKGLGAASSLQAAPPEVIGGENVKSNGASN
jgi:hypothetical protein